MNKQEKLQKAKELIMKLYSLRDGYLISNSNDDGLIVEDDHVALFELLTGLHCRVE